MARPQNIQLKAQISRASRRLFREYGYDATSYSAIAKACGISRNLVQYHFPKKELLAIDFMERVLQAAQQALGLTSASLQGDFGRIYQVGVCYFAYLLHEPDGYRTFLLDIVRSRDLTEDVLAFNVQWALKRSQDGRTTPDDDVVVDDAVMRAVIVRMGGFYELLYHCLKNGVDIDVAKELADVVRAFMVALGSSQTRANRAVSPKLMDDVDLASVVADMDAQLTAEK
jgi:AcrR family transcriptional regulator